MASNDTDPDDSFPASPSASRTDEVAVESLLADLSRAPLPVEGVRETAGEMAAAANVAAHRPQRATGGVSDGAFPAVVINTTQPLPIPVPVQREVTLPMAPVPGAIPRDTIQDLALVPLRAAPLHTTTPSVRVRSSRRVILAVAAVLAVAAGTALAIVALGSSPVPEAMTPKSAANAATSAPSVSATPASITASAGSAAPSAIETAPVAVRPARASGPRPSTASADTTKAAPPPLAPATTRAPSLPTPASSGDFPWRQ